MDQQPLLFFHGRYGKIRCRSKITQNVTGRFGVVQGNGGDLKMGLPLLTLKQSDTEMYHHPLRLSVMIQAPIARVEGILLRNENLKSLLDNEWIYLLVMDPTEGNRIVRYQYGLEWIPAIKESKYSHDPVLDGVLQELSMERA